MDGRDVDLRSDTVTRPTPGMREAIARAVVGDDTLGDDPTVRELEERIAALLGKERALFFPSGIMANEAAIVVLGRPGTEAVVEASCHLVDWEEAAAAAWAGVQLRAVATPDGILTADAVRSAIRSESPYQPRTSLVCVENTHNAAGGRVMGLEVLEEVRAVADEHGLPIHLDGARLWNASVASGVTVARYAALADTVMVTLSKGLGCPVGSMLAGDRQIMEEAWRARRRLGGGLRQAGILAAAALYALDHHMERLAEDHRRAALLAELAGRVPGVRAIPPETNIVMLDLLREGVDAATVVAQLARRGVRMSMFSPRRMRAVTHMDVDDDGIRSAARELADILTSP
ncbi:MAG TPA: GntG family PLP-dependent aldolase [Longimicrobiales bacterium]|nr:GntG family PLP-dependent aldolase [Longimicrobiales bacterium]